MICRLEVKFVAGRFHATPWDHHVNEGAIEWPPSPARLLRALLAASFADAERPNEPPADAVALLENLGRVLPTYWVPPAREAHVRHYMPILEMDTKKDAEKTTKVIDSFLRFEDDEEKDRRVLGGASSLLVDWPVELDEVELALLQRLCERIAYLGRAESWCELRASVVDDERPAGRNRVEPELDAAPSKATLRLLAWMNPDAWETWRDAAIERSVAAEAAKRGGVLNAKQERSARLAVPARWIDALGMQSSQVRKAGWSEPPGTRWCVYRSEEPLGERSATPKRAARRSDRPKFVVLTLASTATNREVLPKLERCVRQGEVLHRRLARGLGERGSVALLGASDREPVLTDHRHAHLIPLDDVRSTRMAGATREPGPIRHYLLWAEMGFAHEDLEVVRRVDRLPRSGRRNESEGGGVADQDLFVTTTLEGDRDALERFGLDGRHLRNLVGPSKTFESVTPYVPARHLKTRYGIEDDVRRELGFRAALLAPGGRATEDWIAEVEIEVLEREVVLKKRLREFERRREHRGHRPPTARFFGLRLRFPNEVIGPLTLGFGAHWGLGLFEATRE